MQTTDEIEIDLLQMLYKACTKWRSIVVFAVVLLLLVGLAKGALNFATLNDPETFERMKADYEAEVLAYEAEGKQLETSIKTSATNLELQKRYNEESLLMKIDSDEEWTGKVILYIGTDYQIMPGSSIQNENPAYKIVNAYVDYATGGDFYTQVQEGLSFEIVGTNYLKEVLGVWADGSRYAVTISAVADTKEHCSELLNVATRVLTAQKDNIEKQIDDHTLQTSTAGIYSQMNSDREREQLANMARANDLEAENTSLVIEYKEWREKKGEIQVPVLDSWHAVRNAIKWGILGGVGGAILLGVVYCLAYIMSGKVEGSYLTALGLNVIGELPVQSDKKVAGIDLLLCKMFGIRMQRSEYADRLSAVAIHTGQLWKTLQDPANNKIAVVSDLKAEEVAAVTAVMQDKLSGECAMVQAGNLLVSADASKKAEEASAVVLVAKQGASFKKDVEAMVQMLRACDKKILGVVLTGVDAR